jgi:hypothetical protein
MVAKVTGYYAIIFDFELDIFKRKMFRQLHLYKESHRIGVTKRSGSEMEYSTSTKWET